MHYYLFHPTLRGACDSADLLSRFVGIGKSYSHAMELGTEKIRSMEANADDAPLIALIESFKVTIIDKAHAAIIDKVIDRFGFALHASSSRDKGPLSMVSLLLDRGRYDVIDQIINTSVLPAAEFTA